MEYWIGMGNEKQNFIQLFMNSHFLLVIELVKLLCKKVDSNQKIEWQNVTHVVLSLGTFRSRI